MATPKLLHDTINKLFKEVGFKKIRSDTWCLDSQDTIEVVNLQKSNYGNQYFVNLAIWIKLLGDLTTPLEHQCHIRLRWSELNPRHRQRLQEILDFENDNISEAQRTTELTQMITSFVIPFFASVHSLSDLRTKFQSNTWPTSLVQAKARGLFQ